MYICINIHISSIRRDHVCYGHVNSSWLETQRETLSTVCTMMFCTWGEVSLRGAPEAIWNSQVQKLSKSRSGVESLLHQYMLKMIIHGDLMLLGGLNPSEKYESQLG